MSEMHQFVYSINDSTCVECGSCRRFCPITDAIYIDEHYQHTIDPDVCTGCGICVAFCPADSSTIHRIPIEDARSKAALNAIRRVVWRGKWHFETHPVMGPLTEDAQRQRGQAR